MGLELKQYALNKLIEDIDNVFIEVNELLKNPNRELIKYKKTFIMSDLHLIENKLQDLSDKLTGEYNIFLKDLLLKRVDLLLIESRLLSSKGN